MKCFPNGEGPLHCSGAITTPPVSEMMPRILTYVKKIQAKSTRESCSGRGEGCMGQLLFPTLTTGLKNIPSNQTTFTDRFIENQLKRSPALFF
jgi:hypothetical protein